MTDKNKKTASDFTPIFGFVISYFLLHIFDLEDATYFVFSTIVSLIVYMIELHFIKEEYVLNRKNLKTTNFITGLLSLMVIIVFSIGVLSWYRVIPFSWRMALLLISIVIYIAVLFRAINDLISIKIVSEKKKPTR